MRFLGVSWGSLEVLGDPWWIVGLPWGFSGGPGLVLGSTCELPGSVFGDPVFISGDAHPPFYKQLPRKDFADYCFGLSILCRRWW